MAMVRISNSAKYASTFTPTVTYGVDANTKLFLSSDAPLVDLSYYELNGIVAHTVGGSPGGNGILYFSKATYPNLNTQIRAGNTVVDATTAATSTVIGEVFTPNGDPDNWGITISSNQQVGTKNFSGPRRHPISVQGPVTISDDFPSFQSLEFSNPQQDFLRLENSADWNLGTSWTIEFWLKANSSGDGSTNMQGGLWGLLNQGGWTSTNQITVAISDAKLCIGGKDNGEDVRFTEPTPAQWTHVAVVNNAGTPKVYYNGVEQSIVSGTFDSLNYTSSSESLYIGRLAPNYGGYFDGKMAMVRISNSAKYLTTFTPTTTYNFETGTKLFLSKFTPTIDSATHTITNNGVTTSTDLPQTFTGHPNPYNGGQLGATYSLFGDPNITAFAAIPIGARITSNLSGFGIRLVTGNQSIPAGRMITYDSTGLPGGTPSTTSDTYNFYW
jgi:hypothetical protein